MASRLTPMAEIFNSDYWLLWALVLALALFVPVRQLIFVLYVRRARRHGDVDDAEQKRLKGRAAVTAALLCLIFSVAYARYLFFIRQ